MKVKYDQEVDILRICFSSAAVDESDEQKPGIILDYDKNGDIVGIEILNASKRMENPRSSNQALLRWFVPLWPEVMRRIELGDHLIEVS